MKHVVIIAGPNGAGKITFAREYLLREINCPGFNQRIETVTSGAKK